MVRIMVGMENSVRVMLLDFRKDNIGGSARGVEDLMVLDHLGLVGAIAPTVGSPDTWQGAAVQERVDRGSQLKVSSLLVERLHRLKMGARVRTIHHGFPRGHKNKCARNAGKLMRVRHVSINSDTCRDAAVYGIDGPGQQEQPCLRCKGCEWFGEVIAKTVATDRLFVLDVDGQPSPRTPTNNKDRVVNPQVPGSRMSLEI
ncbi:hypothetical protein PIB30_067632 [Stylosanthes scabra]|uniref:Uncharacterized protein n=1 Tax=Stylosanthes scabra TaxID=79078 RepID=A0ABU6XND4_9FABA|nr:hypothetical protein [Stylosanthes scabra]